jgi:hypothetical protein
MAGPAMAGTLISKVMTMPGNTRLARVIINAPFSSMPSSKEQRETYSVAELWPAGRTLYPQSIFNKADREQQTARRWSHIQPTNAEKINPPNAKDGAPLLP